MIKKLNVLSNVEGFDDGEYVEFYDSGAIASYCVMKNSAFVDKLYEWHRNGKLKCFEEIDENGKGKVKIDKG